jgi:hypothetical protein
LRRLAQHGAALQRRGRAPPRISAPGRIERAIEIGGIGQRQIAQHRAGGGIDHLVDAPIAEADPLAIDMHAKAGIRPGVVISHHTSTSND